MRDDVRQTAPHLFTVAEAAARAHVSKDTIWRHIEKGALKVRRIGPHRRLRITAEALDEYMGISSTNEAVVARSEKPSDFVYFLASENLVKIGVSGLIKNRLTALRTSTAASCRLVGLISFSDYRAACNAERELHVRFASARRHGEWFSLPTETIHAVIVEQGGAIYE